MEARRSSWWWSSRNERQRPTSEFMPVSLLTPIAGSLHVTEGQAGKAIAVSGLFAVFTSLVISSATRGIDRRHVLLALTLAMIASGLMVAFAPNAEIFMLGRALIGVVIGGFWSMSATTVMRLVPEDQIARALGFFNGGNALATTIAAPVGSFLGQYIGWRGTFFCVVPLASLTLAWQFVTLRSMPSARGPRAGTASSGSFAGGRSNLECSPSRSSSWANLPCSPTCARF
jgi:predicted MFS family arabinose efflux permease